MPFPMQSCLVSCKIHRGRYNCYHDFVVQVEALLGRLHWCSLLSEVPKLLLARDCAFLVCALDLAVQVALEQGTFQLASGDFSTQSCQPFFSLHPPSWKPFCLDCERQTAVWRAREGQDTRGLGLETDEPRLPPVPALFLL